MTKQEMQDKLGRVIRLDTYLIIERLLNGEDYQDIVEDLNSHRDKYKIKEDLIFTKKDTCLAYIKEIFPEKVNNEKKIYHNTGIYGIYVGTELVYIGLTTSGFKDRFSSHKNKMKNRDGKMYEYLYDCKEKGIEVSLKPLFIRENAQTKENITTRDLMAMELCLIDMYQPRFNCEGRFTDYIFSLKKNKEIKEKL